MLMLSRRIGEAIIIDGKIKIIVKDVIYKNKKGELLQSKQIRLGIIAPKDIVVDREEIHNQKMIDNKLSEEKC
jgi:carbon storage regulator